MLYNVVRVADVQQCDSVMHLHILFHAPLHYSLPRDIEYVLYGRNLLLILSKYNVVVAALQLLSRV